MTKDKANSFSYANDLARDAEAGINEMKGDIGNQTKLGDGSIAYSKTFYGLTLSAWAQWNNKTIPDDLEGWTALNEEFENEFNVDEKQGKDIVTGYFKTHLWDKHKLGQIKDKRIAASIYDAMINQNFTFGNKGEGNETMLTALNNAGYTIDKFEDLDDAIFHVNSAIESDDIGGDRLLDAYATRREQSYIGSSQQGTNYEFNRGWINRLNKHRVTGMVDTTTLDNTQPMTTDSLTQLRVDTPKVKTTKDDTLPTAIPEPISLESSRTPPKVVTPEITERPTISDLPPIAEFKEKKAEDVINEKKDKVLEKEVKKLDEEQQTYDDDLEKIDRVGPKKLPVTIDEQPVLADEIEEVIDEDVEELVEPDRKDFKSSSDYNRARMKYHAKREKRGFYKEKESEELEASVEEKKEQDNLENIGVAQTQDIEVLNSQGNIETITVPTSSMLEEVTVSGGEAGDPIKPLPPKKMPVGKEEMKPITPGEVVVEEEKEPKLKDFKNSGDYMRARMKYYKNIEDQPEDFIEGELTDEEIIEHVNRERNKESINSEDRNIFNVSSGNNIFKTVIGDIDSLFNNISTSVRGSALLEDEQEEEKVRIVTGGFGPEGFKRTETTTTQKALDAKEKYEKEQGLGELNIVGGETPSPPTTTDKKIAKEKEQVLDLVSEFEKEKNQKAEEEAKLTGNIYAERQSMLDKMNIGINKSTIETLALRNPDALNIEDGIVTDNSGNIIETKQDWINFANKPKDQGGLGFKNADVIYNATSNQFKSAEYKLYERENKIIDGAWDYLKSSISTETGIIQADVINWITGYQENETLDFGKYEKEIKREFLNGLDMGDMLKYYNEEKSTFTRLPIIESMSLKEKETRLKAAKSIVLERQMKILNKAGKDLVSKRDKIEVQEKKLTDAYKDWINLQEKTQLELGVLKEKHGSWGYDKTGKRIYIPRVDMSRWPDRDKSSLDAINESIRQIEMNRVGLNAGKKQYLKDKENYNNSIKDFNTQREELLATFGFNITENAFDDAFTQSHINARFHEAIAKIPWIGKPLDVLSTGVQEWTKLWAAGKTIGAAIPLAINPIAWASLGALNGMEKAGLFDYFYEYGPSKKSDINKGYTHVGQLMDGILNIWGKDWAPVSKDLKGEWMVKGYKSKKETRGGRWLDHVAGGGSNMNLYSGTKGFARLIPYVLHIMKAAPTKAMVSTQKEAVKKFGIKTQQRLAAIGQAKLGKSIAASMNKSFLTSKRFTGVLEMNKINYRITLLDNIADGRARGLNHADAFTYGNALSFVTGLTQSIMPDYLYKQAWKSGALKKFSMDFLNAVKNKDLTKIARTEALKSSLPQFFAMFGKEQLEEYLDVAGHDVVKSLYIAGHSPEIAKVEVNAEIFRATSMLTIPLAGLGSIANHRNTKATIYNHFYNNAEEVIQHGNRNIKALNDRLENLTNSKKDRALKKILLDELKVVENLRDNAEDIRRAINAAPEMVTDTQLDLLIRKHKLVDEKTKLKDKDKVANEGRFQELTDEIAKVDEQIKENSIENYQNILYDRIYKNSLKLAKKMGWTITHVDIDTSTKEGKAEFFKFVEVERKRRQKHNADIDKQINNIKKEHKGKTLSEEAQVKIDQLQARKQALPTFDGPGVIYYNDVTKNHEIVVNKQAAEISKNQAVMLHEMLHAALRQTVLNNPNSVKGMAWMLRQELLNNPEKYNRGKYQFSDRQVGKFDAYKYEKDIRNMSFDEMFTIFTEALAQGDITVESGLISKISDFVRRIFREIGVNFQITETNEMINFLRDFNNEVLSGRKNFSRGMRKIINDGTKSAIGGRPLIKASPDAIAKAKKAEKIALKAKEITEIWAPQYVGRALSLGGKVTRKSIYDEEKIKKDLDLSKNTKKIVEENKRLRNLILEEGIKKDGKIVASEDLQTRLVENNLPMAMGLARFAANNPKIMGLEEDKKVTYEQFLSGYYLQLSKLAGTYDASVNEFGQYLNTILPIRYGQILEEEKRGAIEGARVEFDYVPDEPVDEDIDITPDDIVTGPKIDTAERLEVKDKTKPFIDKTLKQLKKLENLRVKLSEKQDKKVEEEIAKLTSDLESKGALDLDIESLTVKQAPNLLYKTVAKTFGIDEDKLNPNSKSWLANLRKKEGKRGSNEVRSAQRAVAKHAQLILSTIFNEGHTSAFKSSGMPNTLLKFGYTKGSKRIGNNFPQYKKPNLSENDLLKFVGIEKVTKNGVTAFNFNVDRNTSAKLLAIAQMVDRNMSLQGINEYLEESGDMTAKIKNSIEDGLSNASKSIYYINNTELQPIIKERLPLLGYKLQNVDDNWTNKQIKDIVVEVYKDTKVNGIKFANDLLKKTAVINKYKLLKRSSIVRKETPISLDKFLEQEFANIDIFEGVMAMLGISVDRKEDLYTKDNIKSVRKQVGDFALTIDEMVKNKELSKKEAMELLFLFEQQHITAAKMGNGLYQAIAGTNDLVLKNKIGKQRDQVFGSEDGAPIDFRLFVNQRMNNLQIPLTVKEANKIKKDLGISTLFAQKSKAVIENIINGKFDFDGRTAEAILARKLVKMQMEFYAKLYKKGEITNEHYMMHMLTFGSSMSTVSRRAASLYGIQEGLLSNDTDGKYIYGKIENIGKDLEYEHGKPHGQLILELNEIVLNEKESNWDKMMDEVFVDYKVNIITKAFDKVLTASGVKDRMVPTGEVYEKGKEHGWEQRLYSKLTLGNPNVKTIISLDGKKTKHGQSFSKSINILPKSVAEINVDKKISKGIEMAKSINYTDNPRGITVLDFDDTLATSKSQVISTAPDGTIRKLTAEEFAKEGADLLDQGWTHDFSEFSKVIDGKVASLFKKALKLQKKFGPKNMFVLTARPADSAQAIFEFLKANGLNIPLENITGLANSTPEAKALWIAEKVGEGYNDFYFADDALQNVQAVQNMLNQFDVKSKVQQAKASYSIEYNDQFNQILEETTGVEAEKRFSRAKAKKRGEEKSKWQIFVPPSADDFVGLFYYFLGKGKQGEKHFEFFKKALIDPLNRAYRSLNSARQAIATDYKKLNKQFPDIRKKLYKKLPGTEFTHGDAIRVYLWDKAGFTIPGLSPTDQRKLVSMISQDADLKVYADTLGVISRAEEGYVEPNDNWLVEDIRVDLMNGMAKVQRKKFFAEFLENVKIIFSEANLNKIEAIYGSNFREALEDILYRIENGTNRSFGSNRLVNRFMNWINGAIGTTMFFNSRSATLQTLSTVNFINWSDNNILEAAKTFANQKQFWSDFAMIFNSTFLKQRRAGLNIDLNANELTNYVANSKTPIKSALNWLLQKGFLPTQMMDSFAIAMGGASFYRNRVKKYLVEGMTQKEAEEQAFLDMQAIAEETQQSARPDRISQQQASVLGRLILAFQNTPMQYTRLMKKAMLDLAAGRGDAKTHISRIIYYGAIQNLIFYSLQTALFAMMFGDDDDEEFMDKKKERVLNDSVDSVLRGMGVGGAVVSTVKNMGLKFIEEQKKPRYKKDENALLMELLNLSPPIGIKARQVQTGTKTLNWNQDALKEIPLYNLENPIWEAGFNYTQAFTNVPLARIHTKVTNIREATKREHESWQRVAMLLGWSRWNLGVKSKTAKSRKSKKRKKLILR